MDAVSKDKISEEELFIILSDDLEAPEDQLPDTGLSRELEKAVSPVFIKSEKYGTRSSTVILVNNVNEVLFVERSLNAESGKWVESRFSFQLDIRNHA